MAFPVTTTRVNEVRKAMKAQLEAALPADVTVARGYPEDDATDRLVVIGDGLVDQNAAAMGQRRRREVITVNLDVQVVEHTETTDEVADLALSLFAEVEDILRQDPTLGLKSLIMGGVAGFTAKDFPGPNGARVALIEARFSVEARI